MDIVSAFRRGIAASLCAAVVGVLSTSAHAVSFGSAPINGLQKTPLDIAATAGTVVYNDATGDFSFSGMVSQIGFADGSMTNTLPFPIPGIEPALILPFPSIEIDLNIDPISEAVLSASLNVQTTGGEVILPDGDTVSGTLLFSSNLVAATAYGSSIDLVFSGGSGALAPLYDAQADFIGVKLSSTGISSERFESGFSSSIALADVFATSVPSPAAAGVGILGVGGLIMGRRRRAD